MKTPPDNERRPTTGAAVEESLGGDQASVATATVVAADYNSDSTWLLHVRCTYCGELHRHAWKAGDREHGEIERVATCGWGAYELVGLERVIP